MNNNPVDTAPFADILNPDFLLGNVGGPFVIGLAVGFFAKKMLKITLFCLGAGVVVVFIMQYFDFKGSHNINLQEVGDSFIGLVKHGFELLKEHLSTIQSGNKPIQSGSALTGFFVGIKLG
jgi:uncharacterized membrane protein (Fun14 family)